ncbi:nicotinate-nucleotide adenylyltransferase [Dysgonomonas sp. PH5-45]|uniref:nicotinate (nicotinamide) nucleotide adenylyltransferase n=1 Tax=unclassified Dysgonomonas TaxID=2630389 RepID=UPI002476E7EB|nr:MULTISPECIES: nicotinate (nicotinamide) nucleotide adenylyltransferase [unclassified Dysgonomonas]MDH6355785.1 nicotinate-nucleotide adenylyltransferase [Dysgonomonas sp. PH5-45]MDH6388682.1 nicotinate-nucleotide adenylyltransferase [Dysgonomonas sp. PH5-37]
MNIGVFSGSFNPIHIGHLILGNYITEFTEINEVWFLVTPQNPLKKSDDLLNETIRYEMVCLALEGYPKLKACNFEFSLPQPSYTVNTLKALTDIYTEHNFSLIIGADNWAVFDKWKAPEAILEMCKVYVYPRLGSRIFISPKHKHRVETLDSPIIEISSTFIRESLRDGKQMDAFLPPQVAEYLKENKAFS